MTLVPDGGNGEHLVLVEKETGEHRGESTKQLFNRDLRQLEKEWDDIYLLIRKAKSEISKEEQLKQALFVHTQLTMAAADLLHKANGIKYEEKNHRRFIEVEKLFIRLEEDYFKHSGKKRTPLNKKRWIWSYLKQENYDQISEETEWVDFIHNNFDSPETNLKKGNQIPENIEEVKKKVKTPLGYVELLCYRGDLKNCLEQVKRMGKDLDEDEIRSIRIQEAKTSLGIMPSKAIYEAKEAEKRVEQLVEMHRAKIEKTAKVAPSPFTESQKKIIFNAARGAVGGRKSEGKKKSRIKPWNYDMAGEEEEKEEKQDNL